MSTPMELVAYNANPYSNLAIRAGEFARFAYDNRASIQRNAGRLLRGFTRWGRNIRNTLGKRKRERSESVSTMSSSALRTITPGNYVDNTRPFIIKRFNRGKDMRANIQRYPKLCLKGFRTYGIESSEGKQGYLVIVADTKDAILKKNLNCANKVSSNVDNIYQHSDLYNNSGGGASSNYQRGSPKFIDHGELHNFEIVNNSELGCIVTIVDWKTIRPPNDTMTPQYVFSSFSTMDREPENNLVEEYIPAANTTGVASELNKIKDVGGVDVQILTDTTIGAMPDQMVSFRRLYKTVNKQRKYIPGGGKISHLMATRGPIVRDCGLYHNYPSQYIPGVTHGCFIIVHGQMVLGGSSSNSYTYGVAKINVIEHVHTYIRPFMKHYTQKVLYGGTASTTVYSSHQITPDTAVKGLLVTSGTLSTEKAIVPGQNYESGNEQL